MLVPLCPAGGYLTGPCSTTLDRSYRREVYTSVVGVRGVIVTVEKCQTEQQMRPDENEAGGMTGLSNVLFPGDLDPQPPGDLGAGVPKDLTWTDLTFIRG